jgi:hypothetical protein
MCLKMMRIWRAQVCQGLRIQPGRTGRIRGSFGSPSTTGNEGRSCTESIVDVMKNVTRLARMSVAPLWLSAIGLERMIDKLVEEQQKTKPHGTVRTLWQ